MSLKFHAPSNSLIVRTETLEKVAHNIFGAMKAIRIATGITLDKYESSTPLSNADLAQQRLITIARDLGIDLGADWANEIDLRSK